MKRRFWSVQTPTGPLNNSIPLLDRGPFMSVVIHLPVPCTASCSPSCFDWAHYRRSCPNAQHPSLQGTSSKLAPKASARLLTTVPEAKMMKLQRHQLLTWCHALAIFLFEHLMTMKFFSNVNKPNMRKIKKLLFIQEQRLFRKWQKTYQINTL